MKETLRRVGLVILVTAPGPGWASGVTDHLACYKVRDSAAKATYTATVDGLAVQAGCTIKLPAALTCVPASKRNVVPTPPGGGGIGRPNGFTCYKVKCPKVALPPVTVEDQFGSRAVTPSRTQLVCAPDAGPTDGGFPATGQTTCWDDTGTVIPCAGTGHDADTHAGAPLAYVDNGDGTITDVNTGLMWEKQSAGDGSVHDIANTYAWDQTFSGHVDTLNSASFAGRTDWRVPNEKELYSIVNFENFAPPVSSAFNNNCSSPCTVLTCSCTQTGSVPTTYSPTGTYWTSSSAAFSPQYAFAVYFGDGSEVTATKASVYDVRAVRGGS